MTSIRSRGSRKKAIKPLTPSTRASILALTAALAMLAPVPARAEPFWLDQGWDKIERKLWYTLSQGSRLIPLDWLSHLEQPSSEKKFLEPDFIHRFRFLQAPSYAGQPPGLPLGFVEDKQDVSDLTTTNLKWKTGQDPSTPWVGMNCSACHTSTWKLGNKSVIIDGGTTTADFQSFVETLILAVKTTLDEEARFDRFAKAVLAKADTPENRALLKTAMQSWLSWNQDLMIRANPTMRYGFARLDAVGFILNKTAQLAERKVHVTSPADAPVSYPFIWNAGQQPQVQWNGMAKNSKRKLTIFGKETDFGALARNTGEVIGVFADFQYQEPPGISSPSSVRIDHLIDLERTLGSLWSPRWPELLLNKLDQTKVKAGEGLFAANCGTCHGPMRSTEMKSKAKVHMEPLIKAGTDIWMACNAAMFEAPAGKLKGELVSVVNAVQTLNFKSDRFGENAQGLQLLTHTVEGSIIGKFDQLVEKLADDIWNGTIAVISGHFWKDEPPIPERLFADDQKNQKARKCLELARKAAKKPIDDNLFAYKARPLNGIWATAPYLHNGSVPTLYDLLLPSKMRPHTESPNRTFPDKQEFRPDTFWIGSGEFDAVKVGIKTKQSDENSFEFKVYAEDGQPIPGNANSGHEYGVNLTDVERDALVEYMKSL